MKKSRISDYKGPDQEKHKPLDRTPTKRLIEAAQDADDPLDEICVRVPLSTGLRVGELVHLRPRYVGRNYSDEFEEVTWYVEIPPFIDCIGGTGETGKGNADGADLHNSKGKPCYSCRNRAVENKDWLTEKQKQQPGFSPKNFTSIEQYQWFFPGRHELGKKLKSILDAHGQFPIQPTSVNHRIRKVAQRAGLDDVRSTTDSGKINITAHALRHTYGCKLGAHRDFNINSIMTFMRHATPSMAIWYSDQWGERRRAKIAEFEDEFS